MQSYLPAVKIAERFADGFDTADELQAAREAAYFGSARGVRDAVVETDAFEAARWVLISCLAIDGGEFWVWQLRKQRECRSKYTRLVIDVFGLLLSGLIAPYTNWPIPSENERFRRMLLSGRIAFDANWRTSTVGALARQMYDSRDFSAMPILGDALQDAGCGYDDILNHCRDPEQPHIRGCWVVDLVLGKE